MLSRGAAQPPDEAALLGIPELDDLRFGAPAGHIGKYNLYDLGKVETTLDEELTGTWSSFEDFMQEMELPMTGRRRAKNIILKFEHPDNEFNSPSTLYKFVREQMGTARCLMRVSSMLNEPSMVFIHRQDDEPVPVMPIGAKAYKFKSGGRGNKSFETIVEAILTTKGSSTSNFVFRAPQGGQFSFDELLNATRSLTEKEIHRMKGIVECKPMKQRTEFDSAFMRCLSTIHKLKDIDRVNNMMINAFNPKTLVCPMELLINMGQEGCRLKEVEMHNEVYSLRQLLTNAEIMSRYTILILGANGTTGFGKTQFALRLYIYIYIYMNICV